MFAQRLKQLREKRGINQITLAKDLSVSQSTIGNWEAGIRVPDVKTIERLAEYFHVSTDYLLGKDGGNIPPEISVIARYLSEVPEEDREQLINTFKNTVDIYLKAKGLK